MALVKIDYFDVSSNESTHKLALKKVLRIAIQVAIHTLKLCITVFVQV